MTVVLGGIFTEKNMGEEVLKELGFDCPAEFYRMVANVDMSSPEKLSDFKRWRVDDGTKTGLEALPTVSPNTTGEPLTTGAKT